MRLFRINQMYDGTGEKINDISLKSLTYLLSPIIHAHCKKPIASEKTIEWLDASFIRDEVVRSEGFATGNDKYLKQFNIIYHQVDKDNNLIQIQEPIDKGCDTRNFTEMTISMNGWITGCTPQGLPTGYQEEQPFLEIFNNSFKFFDPTQAGNELTLFTYFSSNPEMPRACLKNSLNCIASPNKSYARVRPCANLSSF